MATKIAPTTDMYLKLVKQFRLVPIKDRNHLEMAHQVIGVLMQEDLDSSGEDYLDVLTDLVEAYEDLYFPIPDASDVDVLRELMRSNSLGQTELSKKVGISQSTISAVLKGARKLTKDQIVKLAEFFNIDPTAFLPNRSSGGSLLLTA